MLREFNKINNEPDRTESCQAFLYPQKKSPNQRSGLWFMVIG